MVALCGAGMLTVPAMKEISLRKTTDKTWGIKEKEGEKAGRVEAGEEMDSEEKADKGADEQTLGEAGDGTRAPQLVIESESRAESERLQLRK